MTALRLTPLAASLPSTVPFVGPETQERGLSRPFRARLGANESLFGPSPRAVEAMARAAAEAWMYGDPDQLLGYTEFLLELGAEPAHVLATNGNETWAGKVRALFESSPYGAGCKVYPTRDLWHMRSLLFTEPVDFLIGNTYGKYLERDTGTPLIRLVFPIFDRHHYHRFPTWGYAGGLRLLVTLLDEFFEALDANTIIPGKTDYSYDIIR